MLSSLTAERCLVASAQFTVITHPALSGHLRWLRPVTKKLFFQAYDGVFRSDFACFVATVSKRPTVVSARRHSVIFRPSTHRVAWDSPG